MRTSSVKNNLRGSQGTTLVELMVVVAILGVLFTVGPTLFTNIFKMWKTTESRTEVQRDARITLTLVEGLLKQARASSITITRDSSGSPPYSKIQFTTESNDTYHFYQSGTDLWIYHLSPSAVVHQRVLASNLRYITFGYPISSDEDLLTVAICFQKGTFGAESKNFYLSTQRIRVLNS